MFRPSDLNDKEEIIRESLIRRGAGDEKLEKALELDEKRKEIIKKVESLEHKRNTLTDVISDLKREGDDQKAQGKIKEAKKLKSEIQQLNDRRNRIEQKLNQKLLELPNVLTPDVPAGQDEADNRLEDNVGTKPDFNFEPRAHWTIGEQNGWLDFDKARKLSGSRFCVFQNEGVYLKRALEQFMLDVQTKENGYTETSTPELVNKAAMTGTGQLPKFEEDMYQTKKDGQYLIPTSEVTLVNLFRDEILSPDKLPIKRTALTSCFRREAGSAGKDTKGILRQHQFRKVELVQITQPEQSKGAHNRLLNDARIILDRLNLPYRVITLCGGDTGFAAAKTYDIEVWVPSQKRYREISSCSNCKAFQAKRADIQFRPKPDADTRYVHTLNGSGLAVGRLWLAVVENYQNENGTITVPEALRPYLGDKRVLGPSQ